MGLENPVDPALLSEMLAAREERWNRRLTLASGGRTVISVTLCLPLQFRVEAHWRRFLERKCRQLQAFWKQQGIEAAEADRLSGADGDAFFFLTDAEPETVKRSCVRFECLPYGRLLDADVMRGGEAVGRSELGLPPRKCFLCGRPAAECVSRGRHAPEEVAAWVKERENRLSLNLK